MSDTITQIDVTKGALFTDIHFGARDSDKVRGIVHNEDNDAFIDWMIKNIKKDKEIDGIFFLGDWNQHRTAINLHTLKFAYEGMKKLNDLGLPIYVILGNHDLYKKNDRSIHSLHFFEQFDNVMLIEDPMVLTQKNKEYNDVLMVPFLMHGEESTLTKYAKVPTWFGHFEFDGYQVSGSGNVMVGGVDPVLFKKPEIIISGHFHKRQTGNQKNIVYMGNPFPTDFGDAGDLNRGYATYDFRVPTEDALEFFNWGAAPAYLKTTLSELLSGDIEITDRTYVKCVVDTIITYEESAAVQKEFIEEYNPRSFTMEESPELLNILEGDDDNVGKYDGDDISTVDEMVIEMLTDVDSEQLDSNVLVNIYNGLIIT